MKKRLLSAFLAVMMVLTMAPVAFAAEEAGNGDTLKKLFTDVKAGESGSGNVTVTIDKDYNLTGYNWTALTVDGYNGAGIVTVEGNNHTITGLNTSLFAGGFAGTSGIVIKDLTLDNVSIEDTTNEQGIGAFINNVDSMPKIELNNCHLTDSTITSTGGARVGGLIGWTSGYNKKDDGPVDTYITVTNCSVENTKITAKGSVGGIIGHAGANPATYHTFTNNTVTGCTLHSTDDGGWRVGVVVGTVNVGEVALNNTTESGNTVTQTGKTAPAGQSNLYGRFVPGTTGKLVIDSTAVFDSSIVAVVDNKGYKTLADAVAAAQGGATVKLLKDVTEDVVIPADKTITLDLNGKTLTNSAGDTITVALGAKLTIEGKGTVDNVTHARAAVFNNGEVVLNGGTFVRSKENGINAENSGGNSWYTLLNHGTMTINDGTTVLQNGHFSSMVETGYARVSASNDQRRGYVVGTNAEHPSMTINGGMFTGGLNTVKNDDNGTIEIKGGTFTNYTQAAFQNHHIATITGGTFDGVNVYAILNCGTTCDQDTDNDKHQLTITGGNFNGKIYKGGDSKDGKTHYDIGSISISGGYFTTDPSAYVASDYVAGTSDVSGYSYKVVAKTNTGSVEVKPDVADPEVKVDKIPQKDQETVKAAAETVFAPTLGAAAVDEAQKINEDKANELLKDVNVGDGVKKLYVQSSLKVEPTAYDETTKTLALEITPQYRVVASTADTADKIKLDGDTKNAQVVQDYQTMNITKATVVTMELPTGFAVADGDKLSIQHTKNGTVEYYTGTVTEQSGKHLLTFTTNGFSPFVISVPAASIGENVYPTLQAAADAAKSTDVISVKSGASHELNFTTTKSVKVKNDTGVAITVKFNGTNKDVAKNATETFSYTKPSSGGSSGGSSSGKTTYKVTTSAVNNGGVNASPSNAEKGAAITITLSPDKGYKLDKLTVTDGSGKTVSTVKKSDTVYTFTMPASAVKVGVSYVKATETPSKTKFNDVSANDWFASAVDYVTGKGMMNGTADNTFSPKANTTRGMVVTVLYRLENQPSTSAASFTDVASGAYYANAVAWANANGIVSGYGSGKFGPNDKVTREQLAAILYRYAQYKKYDVSVGEDTNILSYNDAQSISSYAIPAIQWACGAGVVTGKSGSKLDPKGNATRAEVAAMLMRFCENVK